jgi:acetyltransferase-like isoleucine patch superfamily enzyme
MLLANHKTIALIGFANSTLTQEAEHYMRLEHYGDIIIISPDEFLSLSDRSTYQYGVAFTLDTAKRKEIINVIESENLDCIKYVHDTVVCYNKDINSVIGRGSFVAPYSTILLNAKIGNHCIIEAYCLVAHYAELKDNVIIHAGSMIAGKTTVGSNTVFQFKTSALPGLTICEDVEVGATSTVTKDITQGGVYLGTPARRVGVRPEFKG